MMRVWGVTYDTGFVSAGTTTHEPFDPSIVGQEMRVIADELGCTAVRVTGGVADRLDVAAAEAAENGLEVWYCPFTNGLDQEQLATFVLDAAERAERLRRTGASVVFVVGSEISLFTSGFLPGADLAERVALLSDRTRIAEVLPRLQSAMNEFLGSLIPRVRDRFAGPVTYASLPHEGVDWSAFDVISSDAVYPDAGHSETFRHTVRAATESGTPFAVTEFGCTTYRGAAALGARSEQIIEWGDDARPRRLTTAVVRDEDEQADAIGRMLRLLDEEGVDTAFVNTFARRDLPHSPDPAYDFDVASWGIVKVLDPTATSSTHPELPWEPKAAFHALADFGRQHRASNGQQGRTRGRRS